MIEEETTRSDIMEIAQKVAQDLSDLTGDEWQAVSKYENYARLRRFGGIDGDHPRGLEVSFGCQGLYKTDPLDGERLSIHGCYPVDFAGWQHMGQIKTINVSANRTPRAIAQDFSRRLLPRVEERTAEAREYVSKSLLRHQLHEAVAQSLAEAGYGLPNVVADRSGRDYKAWGGRTSTPEWNAKISAYNGVEITMELRHLTQDLATDILELVKQYYVDHGLTDFLDELYNRAR